MNGREAAAPWTVVVPVKPFAVGKSRLAAWAGAQRAALARSFYLDTLDAIRGAAPVARVVVVTADAEAAALARMRGADVVRDRPLGGLNAAVERGVAYARTPVSGFSGTTSFSDTMPVAVLTADLPALRSAELRRVLVEASRHRRAFLADHTGRGTTLLAAVRGHALRPEFEGPSRRKHGLSGAVEVRTLGVPSVRLDVDTVHDLRRAEELGLGPHTARIARALTQRIGP
ncbi:2-phospho-L-lactate guanylyltransferase [Streptomyces sp. B-S-A6]|uniref:Phosphoenolpyruvate guanylyltransferase n=2 Tax=Streptomyces cavernicola TaxID=3043613 RepID=A0ABT6SJW2_9ACTN|nr:2-phospho-L-lactate guanylyltransferase [Streptomyces sp. B-S-A6]MDI3408240.1 2-phospho-L-lactate guanylyltransferase [Streptomyces sp. B-S-A6]